MSPRKCGRLNPLPLAALTPPTAPGFLPHLQALGFPLGHTNNLVSS